MTDRLKIPMDKVIADYQRGMNTEALAEKYGGSGRTIQRRLKKAGVWEAYKNPNSLFYEDDPTEPPVDYESRCVELEETLDLLVKQISGGHIYHPQDSTLARVLESKCESDIASAIEISLRQHYLEEAIALRFKDLRRANVSLDGIWLTLSEGYALPVSKVKRVVSNQLGDVSSRYELFKSEIIEAYLNGASTRDLGFQWDTSTDVMRRQLRVWGVSDSNRVKKKRIRHDHRDQLPMQDIIKDYKANMPMTRLEQKYYVSASFIEKCLRKMGVPKRPPLPTGAKPKQVESTTLSLLVSDYNAGSGVSFLSRKYNLSRSSIKRSLEQAGVELRRKGRSKKV
jgi:Mor family transcriptional regulator